jgi:hypothetical protein
LAKKIGRERIIVAVDCMRRVHTQPATRDGLWGEKRGMYPESNTLPKQPYPDRSAAGMVDFLFGHVLFTLAYKYCKITL